MDFTDLGEPTGVLLDEDCAALELGRDAYGSAVAGRLISARRGFIAGRMGAEESEDRGAPVGTVLAVDLDDSGALDSAKAGWADSGREGMLAFLLAAIASFNADRPAPGPFAVLPDAGALWPALGFDGSFSRRLRDLESRSDRITFALSGHTL